MIPVEEAVEKAMAFAQGVLEPARTRDILLEEVEASTKGVPAWLITLSLPDPALPAFAGRRQYKTFAIDRKTGEVIFMKIRQLSETT